MDYDEQLNKLGFKVLLIHFPAAHKWGKSMAKNLKL